MADSFGYHKMFRPDDWREIRGNQAAAESFRQLLDKKDGPRVYLITGPSGCGKTTMARIAANHLECSGMNLNEYNAAKDRGIDLVRHIEEEVRFAVQGVRCWLLDEAHRLTTQAQEAFLKTLEDGPSTDYFFICTTNPEVFKLTFLRRCTKIIIKPLDDRDVADLLEEIVDEERLDVSDEVVDRIVDVAQGSPAIALSALQTIADLSEKLALEKLKDDSNLAVLDTQSKEMGELIKTVFWGKTSISAVMKIIATMKKGDKENPESIRLALVNCAGNNLLAGGKNVTERSLEVLDHLCDGTSFYNKSQAWATLVYKLHEVYS